MRNKQLIGIGLNSMHFKEILERKPDIGCLEIHCEDFFYPQQENLQTLYKLAKLYPISLNGSGLSLGAADEISKNYLTLLKNLADDIDPIFISQHLSWNMITGKNIPAILPIPYNEENLNIFATNVLATQDFLKREILIQNPASYIEFKDSDMPETEFLVEICRRTGAKILLDVNNLFISSVNHKWNALGYMESIPEYLVKEIHIAGHSTKIIGKNEIICIETRDRCVIDEVWDLYGYSLQRFGTVHTVLEWDYKIPKLTSLIDEAMKALNYFPSYENIYERT